MTQNNVIDEKFASIVDSICYWLGYQTKIGRKQFIHEASLRYPIADSITGNGIAIKRVVLEKLHPCFKNKKIDLVVYHESIKKPEAEQNDKKLIEVYEFKLAKNSTGVSESKEHQRVFDDIVRLAYYNFWQKKECFFLMCGTYEDFKAYFVGQKAIVTNDGSKNTVTATKKDKDFNEIKSFEEWKPSGLYKDWFSFKIGESQTKIFEKSNQKWGLIPFQKSYKIRETKNSFGGKITITTTCLALSPVGDKNKTHAAGIWKIEGN